MTIIPLNQIQAVLFDLDGTLIETDDQAVSRLERRLRPFLQPPVHRSERQ